MWKLIANYNETIKLENLLIRVREESVGEEREKLMNDLIPKYKEAVISTSGLYPQKTMRIFLRTFEEMFVQ